MSILNTPSSLARIPSVAWRLTSIAVLLVGMAIALCTPGIARAEGITVRNATVQASEDGWIVDAEFDLQISSRLEEAVSRGVPLYFVVEFEVSQPRWYWFDDTPVQGAQVYKITYTPLLRQYRLSVGNLYQNFTRFDEVKRVLSRLRGWQVADKNAMRRAAGYQANLRMRLDTSQLPKPFQLNAMASRDWTLDSEWYRWAVAP